MMAEAVSKKTSYRWLVQAYRISFVRFRTWAGNTMKHERAVYAVRAQVIPSDMLQLEEEECNECNFYILDKGLRPRAAM